MQRVIKAIAAACDIHKNITSHSLRDGYGTHLLAEGFNLRTIQELLGHTSPVTTGFVSMLRTTDEHH